MEIPNFDLISHSNEEQTEIQKKHLIESLQAYQYLNEIDTPKSPLLLGEEDIFFNEGK